ncbi:hypothetical protein [Ruminococcus sp. HUN007]|uniref:hypothetical protein n=1 Tax=Ruminococcus sp. HUN007 TaxID=1514668 RepID=UPI0005D2BEF4|nr:hypothetical protein [Ruminococcus sp. HUN007]
MKNIIRKTVPFVTAAALLAVPAYQTADFFITDISSAEYTAEAGDEIIIELGEVSGEAGTKVKLPVYIKNAGSGISALQFDYDTDSSFRVTRGLKGDFGCTWTIGSSSRTVQFLEADGMNVTEGKIGRLEIDIPAGTPDGVYEISGFNFEGSRVGESGKQEKLEKGSFSGVSGKIIIGSGEAGNNEPEPSPSEQPSQEAAPSPSKESQPSPSEASSPSVKPSPSVKTSPSSKSKPSAKASAGTAASPSAKSGSSASPASSPSAGASQQSGDKNSSSSDNGAPVESAAEGVTEEAKAFASPSGKEASVSGENGDGKTAENAAAVTDAEGNAVPVENEDSTVGENNEQKTDSPLSAKVRKAVIIGAAVAVAAVLLVVLIKPLT